MGTFHNSAIVIYFSASGYGTRGGQGRCYPAWRKFAACMQEADDPHSEECTKLRENYDLCLRPNAAVCIIVGNTELISGLDRIGEACSCYSQHS